MPTIDEVFAKKVDQLLSNAIGKELFVFKGFGFSQIEYLIKHPNSLLDVPDLVDEGALNIKTIYDRGFDIAMSIRSANKPLVGFYEELLAIRDFLGRIPNDGIIVVENTALSPWTPCCIPYEQALTLFDYLQSDKSPTEKQQLLAEFYGDVKLLDNEKKKALLLSPSVDRDGVTCKPFWTEEPVCNDVDDSERIELGSQQDWEYRLDIMYGHRGEVLFLKDSSSSDQNDNPLFSALTSLGIPFGIDESELYVEKFPYSDKQFLPLLRKYWGENASFRPLLFYKNPDWSCEIEEISQGEIIAEIVDQCERAAEGEQYESIFITAPTGAGKSILFQLPALYLAEKYEYVTIVVSPLIALMNDQVAQLRDERGISIAASINSSMTIDEREDVMRQIQQGSKSLLYLAPEFLLTTNLQSFLGGRKVGLVVIDEAHTVIGWGADFRPDYWFVGDFLKQAGRNGMVFPVLCLTATAVYSPTKEGDVVNETIRELGLGRVIIHLGRVKRENIEFDICYRNAHDFEGKIEDVKQELTLKRMREYITKGEKVLAYFPYRSQVNSIHEMISLGERTLIRRYHGRLSDQERKLAQQGYKSGEAMGLFCTKAFGMGVDVGDIKHVVHFAPTGSLADYVQEIGRVARNPQIQGIAHIDYFDSDMRYVRALNGMSEMQQYQLCEMLKKIFAIYEAKKRRNLLISAETFEYLFNEKEVEARTKAGLMLLAKDLAMRHTFPVLVVKPRAMITRQYINVPAEIETQFLVKYGQFAKPQEGSSCRTIPSGNAWNSEIIAYSTGRPYLVDLAGIWENFYPQRTFGDFKRVFFSETTVVRGEEYHVSPRIRVEIRYTKHYNKVMEELRKFMDGVVSIFHTQKTGDVKQFTYQQFARDLAETLGEKVIDNNKITCLLDIFTQHVDLNATTVSNSNRIKVLQKRKQGRHDETVYFVNNMAYSQLEGVFSRYIRECNPIKNENGEDVYHRFYPAGEGKTVEIMPLMQLLELLGLANYEIRGGEKAEVFIRINDPEWIKYHATHRYSNIVLRRIKEQHEGSRRLLSRFFKKEMSTEERWDLIEQYFLGNEQFVAEALGLTE